MRGSRMSCCSSRLRRLTLALIMLVIALSASAIQVVPVQAYPFKPLPAQPGFAGGLALGGAAIEYSSPTLADLNGDGMQEIVVGGSDGKVYAIGARGGVLWVFDTAVALNALVSHPGKSAINAAPAVGDLDGDGSPEIVVAVGAPTSLLGYNGGMIVLDAKGKVKPGWPQVGMDHISPNAGPSDGYLEGFYSSPALGDIDGDGDLEIVAGGWDMRMYAWHHDGRRLTGWPRFIYETIWSSPALADLDQDGQLEIIFGSDRRRLHVRRVDGTPMPGFPKLIDQVVFSSPAVADINGDGSLDIVVGTGNFDAGTGYAVYAWDAWGNLLPGWPVRTGGYVLSSPSVADLDGDGRVEVIVGCNDGKVYAMRGNGSLVAGWPVTVSTNNGATGALNFSSPVLANFDGDPQPEVFINHFCDTVVIDGNGALLTHVGDQGPSGKPSMYMFNAWCLGTTPAVGDIDNDGILEVVRGAGAYDAAHQVIGNALVYVWKTNMGASPMPWPMFRRNSLHDARYIAPPSYEAQVVNRTALTVMLQGDVAHVAIALKNTGSVAWDSAVRLAATGGDTLTPGQIVALAPGERVAPGQTKTFTFEVRAPAVAGYYGSSWRLNHSSQGWFGPAVYQNVKVGNEPAFYVLTKDASSPTGGVYAGGLAPLLSAPVGQGAPFWNWTQVKAFAFMPDHAGYQLLDSQAGVWQGGSAPSIGGHPFVPNARDILLMPDGMSYYILDDHGILTLASSATPISPAPASFPSAPSARSAALTPDGRGMYVLADNGVIHVGGNAPGLLNTPFFGQNIASKIKLTADGAGAYILDIYGRVWNAGAAPPIAPNYALHMGEDWARDIELTADGKGYYLLDREGNILTGGIATPPLNRTPVWPGQDMAVDLVVTDSRRVSTLAAPSSTIRILSLRGQTHSFTVRLDGEGEAGLNWTATTNQDWLTFQPHSGTTPASLRITVNPGQRPSGTYVGRVEVKCEVAGCASLSIPVEVWVVDRMTTVHLPMVVR